MNILPASGMRAWKPTEHTSFLIGKANEGKLSPVEASELLDTYERELEAMKKQDRGRYLKTLGHVKYRIGLSDGNLHFRF